MKKILLVLGFIIVIGACSLMLFFSPEKLTPDNPAGKTIYYTEITGSGVRDKNECYAYELTAYNEKEKKKISFSAKKQLREGAYVQLYYTLIRGVTHWEEINFKELPEVVQQQYQK
ncbi:YxeA family protein [Bacillus sp. JJ1127]|uniref:YxeA family protein n=1 Tax=Bacillus sp. JJ1127 TaxID=3122952 RepID=UPI0030008C85